MKALIILGAAVGAIVMVRSMKRKQVQGQTPSSYAPFSPDANGNIPDATPPDAVDFGDI